MGFIPHIRQPLTRKRFIDILKDRKARNKNTIIAMVGETGEGKSWTALETAWALSNALGVGFSAKNCIFTGKEFMEKVLGFPRDSTLIYDDAGLEYSAQNWFDDLVKICGFVMQSMRETTRINLVFTVPSQSLLARTGRLLTHYKVVMDRPGRARVYRLKINQFNDRIYNKKKYNLTVHAPPEDLTKAYSERKTQFIANQYQLYMTEILSRENEHRRRLMMGIPDKDLVKVIRKDPRLFKDDRGKLDAALISVDLDIHLQRAYKLIRYINKHHNDLASPV